METKSFRLVHYVNQYFGGIGGEDQGHVSPQVKEGPFGPGRAVQNILGDRGQVVAKATDETVRLINQFQPEIVIAGPAFEAGRYGLACGAVCQAVQNRLHIPAVIGMFEENPGVDLFHKDVYIIRTGNSVSRA